MTESKHHDTGGILTSGESLLRKALSNAQRALRSVLASANFLEQLNAAPIGPATSVTWTSSPFATGAGTTAKVAGTISGSSPGAGGSGANFANFFALMPPDNAATIAVGAALLFPQSGPTAGASPPTRTGPGTFNLPNIEINWQASITEAGQLQLAIGGVGLPNTVVGRATGTDQIVGSTIITTVAPNTVLSVINPAGNAAALTVTPIAGGTHSVSATLSITQLTGAGAGSSPVIYTLLQDGNPIGALTVGDATPDFSQTLEWIVTGLVPGVTHVYGINANGGAVPLTVATHEAMIMVEERPAP
jgi:hypothetical protein